MTRSEAFYKLSNDNGLILQSFGNIKRAWFGNKDFIMSYNEKSDYEEFEVATRVFRNKFMCFRVYKEISPRLYKKLDLMIKELIGEFKEYQLQEKLEKAQYDFK